MSFVGFLSLAGGDDPRTRAAQIHGLRLILLMAVCAEALMDAGSRTAGAAWLRPTLLVAAVLLGGCAVAVALRRRERLATVLAAGVLLWIYGVRFPHTANHHFLILICIGLLAFFDASRENERASLLEGLRWVFVIVFFTTGLQKTLYGLYLQGEYFAYFIASSTRFVDFFRVVLPADELARIQALGTATPGAGPYRIEWLPFVAASNAVVLAELLLPVLLLVRRTRRVALAGSLALIVAIELGAREFLFGTVFVALALLFARGELLRRFTPAFAGVYVLLVVLRWAAPGWAFA